MVTRATPPGTPKPSGARRSWYGTRIPTNEECHPERVLMGASAAPRSEMVYGQNSIRCRAKTMPRLDQATFHGIQLAKRTAGLRKATCAFMPSHFSTQDTGCG